MLRAVDSENGGWICEYTRAGHLGPALLSVVWWTKQNLHKWLYPHACVRCSVIHDLNVVDEAGISALAHQARYHG